MEMSQRMRLAGTAPGIFLRASFKELRSPRRGWNSARRRYCSAAKATKSRPGERETAFRPGEATAAAYEDGGDEVVVDVADGDVDGVGGGGRDRRSATTFVEPGR